MRADEETGKMQFCIGGSCEGWRDPPWFEGVIFREKNGDVKKTCDGFEKKGAKEPRQQQDRLEAKKEVFYLNTLGSL
uniref:Uncharacterized protein n=1 Tax=Lutzomyia longipalpis TaxID=7200 RepID=A0A1B0CN40_LUTLO